MKKKRFEKAGSSYANLGIGFEFIGMFAIPAFAGYWLDGYFEIKNHWLLIFGIFIGFSYGIWYLYRRAKELENEEDHYSEEAPQDSVADRAEVIRNKMGIVGKKIDRLEGRKEK